ncbi:MAG TPA: hypothetical protein VF677_01395, partial [Flavobacterium sp.]
YYYLNPAADGWIRLATGTNATPGWSLTGNAGTTGSNFLGTTDTQDLVIRTGNTGNTERMRVSGTTGNIGISATAPSEKLEIANGNIFINNNATTGNWIRWNDVGNLGPTFNTRSRGTRLVLWPGVVPGNNTTADFAIGIEGGGIWQSVPSFSDLYQHRFYGGTTPLMTITGNGNVGIGTNITAPAARLDVVGTTRISTLGGGGATPQMVVADNDGDLFTQPVPPSSVPGWTLNGNAATAANFLGTTNSESLVIKTNNIERMRVNSAGNVAIGTAGSNSPADKLQIQSGNILINPDNSTGNWIRWAGAGIAPPTLGIPNSIGTKLILFPAAGPGPGATFSDYAMGIDSGTMWYSVPQGNTTFSHKFYGGTTPLMTIRGDGNVGIGTESPGRKFHVNGGLQVTNEINVGGTASTAGSAGSAGQYLKSNGAGAAPNWESLPTVTQGWALEGNLNTLPGTNFLGTRDNQDMVIRTNNTEKMRITSGGNIGIGTNAPAQKLTVAGGNIGLDNSSILMAKNAITGAYENVLFGRFSDNVTYLDGGSGGTFLRTNNGTINQYLAPNGNINLTPIGNTSFGLPVNTVPTQRLDISGNVRIRDINLPANTSTNGTDRVVVADANGVLKTIVPETAIRTINSVNNLPITAADETLLVDTRPPLQNVLVTLPAAPGLKAKKYIVKKIDASSNIVVIVSASHIDAWTGGNDPAPPTLNTPYQAFVFQSDGIKWHIIGRY